MVNANNFQLPSIFSHYTTPKGGFILHQYLFFIGSFPVRAYGLLFMLGIISSGLTAYYIMKRDGRGWHVHIFDFTMYCGLAGIVGGRLWDVFFFDWAYYQHHLTEIPYVWQAAWPSRRLLFGAIAGILIRSTTTSTPGPLATC
mgnify:CR=1 FL=1